MHLHGLFFSGRYGGSRCAVLTGGQGFQLLQWHRVLGRMLAMRYSGKGKGKRSRALANRPGRPMNRNAIVATSNEL
jgi:hypothetical protein